MHGTGKTRFLSVVGNLCYQSMIAGGSVSLSALFRTLDNVRGTFVFDEADFQSSEMWNEIIKILTVVSFIFLPLALIAKIFAMKATDMPFVDTPNGFWIILGIMFAVALLLTLFVARKRWI